jgi:hypothetical protein
MWSQSRIIVATVSVVFLASGAAVAGAAGAPKHAVSASSIARLSSAGATEWNFEALLRETFGSDGLGRICSINSRPGYPLNFPKNDHGCTPLATYSPWIFDFTHLGKSAFHVTSRDYTVQGWVANAAPVLIEGKIIACDKSGRQVLMGYSDEPSDAIECAANPYIYHY